MSSSMPQQFSGCIVNDAQNHLTIESLNQELKTCKCILEDLLLRQSIVQEQSYHQRMLVKSNRRLIVVRTEDIDWIEAWGDYIRLHCKGKVHIVHQKVSDVEMQLNPKQFFRIGRSAIVNVDRIKDLEPLHHGDYLISLVDDTQLNLSRHYRDRLTSFFNTTF